MWLAFCYGNLRYLWRVFLDAFAVYADKGVPANVYDLLEHLDTVSQVADAGALVVSPCDRHLAHGVAAFQRYEEQFRIEAPTLDALQLEDGLRRAALEGFEAALRIGEGQ